MTSSNAASARDTIVGTALSPAHFPNFSEHDFTVFFDEAAQTGSHVTWIFQWGSLPPAASFRVVQGWAKEHGLKFQLWLSPTTLSSERRNPDLPKALHGKSFADADVRRAYTDEVMELAALRPDVLGLATEINFLAQNPAELGPFVTLAQESYAAVKKRHPAQTVTILRVIKAAQRLGFSLDEVADLLETGRHRHRGQTEAGLRQRATVKLAEIEARVADLSVIADTLRAALDAGCTDLIECAAQPQCPLPFAALAVAAVGAPATRGR